MESILVHVITRHPHPSRRKEGRRAGCAPHHSRSVACFSLLFPFMDHSVAALNRQVGSGGLSALLEVTCMLKKV